MSERVNACSFVWLAAAPPSEPSGQCKRAYIKVCTTTATAATWPLVLASSVWLHMGLRWRAKAQRIMLHHSPTSSPASEGVEPLRAQAVQRVHRLLGLDAADVGPPAAAPQPLQVVLHERG